MASHYLYRTTTDKLPEAIDRIESSGDQVLERTNVHERHWALLCRKGEPTAADLTPSQLRETVRDGVLDALRAHAARPVKVRS